MKIMMRACCSALLVVAAIVAGANVASASSFFYNGYTVANEQNISISNPYNISGGAGQVTLIGSGADSGKDLEVWCLDVFTYLLGSDTYQVGPLTIAGAGGSSLNPTLTTQQIGEIGALIVHGDSLIKTSTDTDVSAAIQLAIWEVEYAGFKYTGLDAGAINLAAGYLNDLTNGIGPPTIMFHCSRTGPTIRAWLLSPPCHQLGRC